uniref:Capsid protein n=1 Tax=Grus japonensis Circoviridae sp. TaxID=2815001 RepID=A0A8A4WRK1_9CIRC|nr:MAG: capsid protein [Cyclovirus]
MSRAVGRRYGGRPRTRKPRRRVVRRRAALLKFRRRSRRKFNVHWFTWKGASSNITLPDPSTIQSFDLGGFQLPVDLASLTPLYTHFRIKKLRLVFTPQYNVNQLPATGEDPTYAPECFTTPWYFTAPPDITAIKTSPNCRYHRWNRGFRCTLYPKVAHLYTDATAAAPPVLANCGYQLKSPGWMRCTPENIGRLLGSILIGSGDGVNAFQVYHVVPYITFAVRKI